MNSDGAGELTQGWFSVTRLEPGVTMIGEPLHAEDPKSFLVEGQERAVLIDTGTGVGDIGTLIRELTSLPVTVVTTHAHWDHVGGNRHFSTVLAPAASHAALSRGWSDARMARALAPSELSGPLPDGTDPERSGIPPLEPNGTVGEGDRLDLGGRTLEVLETPGHCPDLIVLLDRANGILFGTDAVYAAGLYAQSTESDLPTYLATLRRLVALIPELRVVYSSHGTVPFAPELIADMERAMVEVMAGRMADRAEFGGLLHDFGAFSIIVPDPDHAG
jgi:glyoxylase-like metal-dependent hydrolase (beta-lactamase superfamily II)